MTKRIIYLLAGLLLMSIGHMASAQTMPDFVIRTAQEINAIYGEGTIDINNTGWDWRGGSIGDGFVLTAGCTNPITLPESTHASGYYRVFFDTNFDDVDDWIVVVYSDYSYFGLCSAPRYQCGTLEPRLAVGRQGHVDPQGMPNNLRAQPGESGQLIGEIPPSGEFKVLDGPRCGSGMSYWLVNYNGSQGWTAEGQDQTYYLLPGGIPTVTAINSTPINPTPSMDPTVVPVFRCGGITSRLYVGLTAQVTPGLPNNLRALPGESGDYLGEIPPGFPFEIVGGPECNSGLLWWQVNYQGTIGWTAEAGSIDDFWLEPVTSNALSAINASTVTRLTSVVTLTPQVGQPPEAVFINERNDIVAAWLDRVVNWNIVDPTVSSAESWSAPLVRQLSLAPLATRLDPSGQVVALFRSPSNVNSIRLEGVTHADEYDIARDNTSLDTAAFYPDDGKLLVLSPRGQGLVFVDVDPASATYRSAAQAPRVILPDRIYRQLEFSKNGRRLVGLTDTGGMTVWEGDGADPTTWHSLYAIMLEENAVLHDVAISPSGGRLMVSGIRNTPDDTQTQGFYSYYDLKAHGATEIATVYYGIGVPVPAVEFAPDGNMLIIVSGANELSFVDANTWGLIHMINTPQPVREIAFNSTGTLMATASNTGDMTLWRAG